MISHLFRFAVPSFATRSASSRFALGALGACFVLALAPAPASAIAVCGDGVCDNGGFWGADDCPTNQFDLREVKAGKLQNVGNANYAGGLDTVIQHPNMCDLYPVWSGEPFWDSTDYRTNFTAPLRWALGVN